MDLKTFVQKSFRKVSNTICKSNSPMAIVTGADYLYFETLTKNLLDSILKYEPTSKIVVWDLGMTTQQISILNNNYPKIVIKQFDFSKFPEHYALAQQSYAWKSACIYETMLNCPVQLMFWLDAGCKLKGHLNGVRRIIRWYSFYSPYSRTSTEELTWHTVSDTFLNIKKFDLNKKMLSGGIVGINLKSEFARRLIWEWYQLSKLPELIVPDGSSRDNHRQDQSLLTLLYYSYKKRVPILAQPPYDFLLHQKKD